MNVSPSKVFSYMILVFILNSFMADKLKFQVIGAISVALSELISAGIDFR